MRPEINAEALKQRPSPPWRISRVISLAAKQPAVLAEESRAKARPKVADEAVELRAALVELLAEARQRLPSQPGGCWPCSPGCC